MQSLQTITADNFFFRVFILLSGYVSTRRQVIRINLLIDACYPNIDENTKLFFFLSNIFYYNFHSRAYQNSRDAGKFPAKKCTNCTSFHWFVSQYSSQLDFLCKEKI